tara:strand:+ start:3870 stop:4937 length:1068 start_codon:yes stop_codon:yes gene_type:complete
MSKAAVTLVNVSSTSETVFIKELNINILFNEELIVTNDFTFAEIGAANSLLTAIQNDKILIKINNVLQSKTDSIAYATVPASGGSGEVNTASNVGAGVKSFKQKSGVDLEFRTITSADFNLTQGTDEIEIQAHPTMITNQSAVTPASGMEVLLNDSGALKKGDVSAFLGASFENNYVNNALFNPTVGAFATNGGTGANTMTGYCYTIHGQVTIDALTITSTGGGGNLATAIYKYDSATAKFNKVVSTETNSWNMAVSGFQTVSITQTTLEQGIYLNVVSTDTGRGGMSSYNQPKLDTPLGRIGTATSATGIMGITKGSVTYAYPMISQLDSIGTGYWNESTGFFNKFCSFLLNEA